MALEPGKKPIVLFSSRYLPNLGGVEFFTANLGHQLASMGYDVIVVTTEPTDDASLDACQEVGEGSFEVLRFNSFGPTRMPFVRKDRQFQQCVARIKGLGSFHALINTRFYDLSRVAARICKQAGVKPVLIDHGTGYIKFANRLVSAASAAYEHAVTANLRRYAIDYYGVSRDASHWLQNFGISSLGEIHNALDVDAFVGQQSGRDFRAAQGLDPDVLCVSFASRLLPEKGTDVMMETARAFAGDARLHFFIAGMGPLEQEVAACAEQLDNLTYVGKLGHPDLAALLLQSDVFCFPTRYSEGLPTSLLEAGACSCALVASHAGGVDEIIPDAQHGIILDGPSTGDVKAALTHLADNRALVASLKEQAYRYVCERFTWEATAQEVLAAFAHTSC